MVCSSGSRRLAVMARLLDAGSFVSQIGAGIMRFYNVRLIITNEKEMWSN